MPSQLFDLRELESAVAATQFAGRLNYVPITASTNDLALKAAHSGARIGVWIADQQLAGRGRGAHTWDSPAGMGLYMSALIAPQLPMQSALALSFRVAIAAQSAIRSVYALQRPGQIDIRWPNDLMLARANGPARKCGGILLETASNPAAPPAPAMLRYAVAGIGVNLNQISFPPELDGEATSLRRELPEKPLLRREPLAAAILVALDAEIRALLAGCDRPATCDCASPLQCSTWLSGKRVRVEARDGNPGYTGTTAGLTPSGFLQVQGDDGQLHTVLSGGLREL